MHFLINGSKTGNEQRWRPHVRGSFIGAVERPRLRSPKSALTLKASLFPWFTVETKVGLVRETLFLENDVLFSTHVSEELLTQV